MQLEELVKDTKKDKNNILERLILSTLDYAIYEAKNTNNSSGNNGFEYLIKMENFTKGLIGKEMVLPTIKTNCNRMLEYFTPKRNAQTAYLLFSTGYNIMGYIFLSNKLVLSGIICFGFAMHMAYKSYKIAKYKSECEIFKELILSKKDSEYNSAIDKIFPTIKERYLNNYYRIGKSV